MRKQLNLEKINRIKGIRDGRSVTRARVEAITFALLNGPPASRTDQHKNFSIACAYAILRPILRRRQCGAYRRKHTIHSNWVNRADKAISEGKVSFIEGEFVRDKPLPKPRVGKHQKLFSELEAYLDHISNAVGHIELDTVRRLIFAKHQNQAANIEQVVLESLLLSGDYEEAWASFVSLSTARRLLIAHGMRGSPLEYTKSPPMDKLVKPIFQYQRDALRQIASAGSCRVINCDQTSVNPNLGRRRAYYNSKKQNKAQVTVNPRFTITVILSVCDDGSMLTPVIIDKGNVQATETYDPQKVEEIVQKAVKDIRHGDKSKRKVVNFDEAKIAVENIDGEADRKRVRLDASLLAQSARRQAGGDSDAEDPDMYEDDLEAEEAFPESETKSGLPSDAAVMKEIFKHLKGKLMQYEELSRAMLRLPCVYAATREVYDEIKSMDAFKNDTALEKKRGKYQDIVKRHDSTIDSIKKQLKSVVPRNMLRLDEEKRNTILERQQKLQRDLATSERKRNRAAKTLASTEEYISKGQGDPNLIQRLLKHDHIRTLVDTLCTRLHQELSMMDISEEQLQSDEDYYVARNEHFREQLAAASSKRVSCPEILYTTQPKGWTNIASFMEYLQRVIIPTCKKDVKTFLILDQFQVHYMPEVLKLMADNDIHPIYIPRSCTPYCQPLDISVMAHFKSCMRRNVSRIKDIVHLKKTPNDADIVLSASSRAIATCAAAVMQLQANHILNGFLAAFTRHPIESLRKN